MASRHWAEIGESTFVGGTWLLYGVHRAFGRWPFLLCLYPVVLAYWLGRAWLIAGRGEMHDDVVVFALKDRMSLFLGALCAADEELTYARDCDDLAGTVAHWAVHPGGRDILDRVQHKVGLADAQLDAARDVLRTCGNMSSATVLFVIRRILLDGASKTGERLIAMAFGPGLTMEGGVMTVLGGAGDGA